MAIRVLLVDDQALFREALHTLLSVQPGLEVVGEAGDGKTALRMALDLKPDVVLMDLQMPILDGVAATRQLQVELPQARVIVLTTFDDDEYVFEGLRAGAIGYLLKDAPSQKLVEAIQSAARGESFLQPSIATKLIAEFARQGQPPASPTTSRPGCTDSSVCRPSRNRAWSSTSSRRIGLALMPATPVPASAPAPRTS